MITWFINVRNLGGMIKNNKVNDFISSKHLNFIANYETKSEVVQEGLYHFL